MSRVVIVSGGATGIGRAVAGAFAAAGDDVAVIGRRPAVLETATAELTKAGARAGAAVTAHPADLRDPREVERVVAEIASAHGGAVDVVVNAAGGVTRGTAPTLSGIAESWRGDFATNVLTAVLLTEAARPFLRAPGGRVIAISSIAAIRGGGGSYSAAKAALHGWIYSLAAELGSDGITANVVAPGYVADTEFFGDSMTPERHSRLVSQTLLGRAGRPMDIAAAVRYLASPEAEFVTGQILQVNGGASFGR